MCSRMLCGRWCIAVGAVLSVVSPSRAELLEYDPFNIPPYFVGPLIGQGAPSSFFSGPWQNRTLEIDRPSQHVVADGLWYQGHTASGGAVGVLVNEQTDSANGRVGRYLATPWDDSTNATYYLSYLASYGAVVNPATTSLVDLGFRATEFWPAGIGVGNDAGRSEIGFSAFGVGPNGALPSNARLRFATPTSVQNLTDTVFNDFAGTHLIVMKFELSSAPASDTISVFLDPDITTEPSIPNGFATGLDFTLSAMGTISYFGSPTGTLPVFDELRVATTFAEAMPPTEDGGPCEQPNISCYLAITAHLNLHDEFGIQLTRANGDVAGVDGKSGADGRVDLRDLSLWRRNRIDITAGSGGISAGLIVPEPACGILVWMTVVSVVGQARGIRF